MPEEFIVLLAPIFGLFHALDSDHILAVSAFASRGASPRKAMNFGVRWGVGHSITLFLMGFIILMLKFTITPEFSGLMELIGGGILIAIGVWLARDLISGRIHSHEHSHYGQSHSHFHLHENNSNHSHRHAPTVVGLLQGLAGTAGVFALIPLTLIRSIPLALLYLLIFGVSIILVMATWGFLLGYFFNRISKNSKIHYTLMTLVCITSFGIGFVMVSGII